MRCRPQASSCRASSCGSRDRQPAGEVLADVGGGLAVERLAVAQQRNLLAAPRCRRAACAAITTCGRNAERTTAHERLDLLADERDLAPWGEVKVQRLEQMPEGLRVAAGGLVQQAEQLDARDCSYSRSPVKAASRSSPNAAEELPDGIGWSWMSLGRVTSCSWSIEVVKKPPAGSA